MNLSLRNKITYSLVAVILLGGGYVILTENDVKENLDEHVNRPPNMQLNDRMASAITSTVKFSAMVNDTVRVQFSASDNLTVSLITAGIWQDTKAILSVMQEHYPSKQLDIIATLKLQNKFGEESASDVVRCSFKPGTISRLQLPNLSSDGIRSVADELWVHESLSRL